MVKNATKIRQRPAAAWLLLALVFFLLSLRAVNPYDIWYLLLAGEKFLQTGTVPQQEFFLYPGHGAPQFFGGWGYGVLAELARRAGGLIGLSLWNAALWTACLLLGVAAIRCRAGVRLSQPFSGFELAALLLALVAIYPLLLDRTAFRPEVTAYILWLLAYALLERGRAHQNFSRALLAVPLLAWLAAWLHTAAALFLPLMFAFMIEALHRQWREEKSAGNTARLRNVLPWLSAMLATALLPILNPNGATQVYANLAAFLPASWTGVNVLAHGTVFQQTPIYNLEYLPFWQLPHLYPLYAQATGLLVILLSLSRRRLQVTLSVLPFALYALLHARGLSLWGLALLVPFGALLQEWAQRLATRRAATTQESYAMPISLLFTLLAGIAMQGGGWSRPRAEPPYAELTQQIRTALPEGGNIFTEYHLGAVTAWSLGENYRVSLAAHMLLPNPAAEQHYTRVMLLQDGWQAELQQYAVKAAILDIVALHGGQIMPLPRRLVYDSAWQLVAVSGTTGVFLRQPADTIPVSERLAALQRYWHAVAKAAGVSTADRSLAAQRLFLLKSNKAEGLRWHHARELETR